MKYVEVKIRLPDWLLKWLEEVARDNKESVEDTIIWLLVQHYNVYERTALIKLIRLKDKCKGKGGGEE